MTVRDSPRVETVASLEMTISAATSANTAHLQVYSPMLHCCDNAIYDGYYVMSTTHYLYYRGCHFCYLYFLFLPLVLLLILLLLLVLMLSISLFCIFLPIVVLCLLSIITSIRMRARIAIKLLVLELFVKFL